MSDDVEVVNDEEHDDETKQPAVSEPGKLMRIAIMLREMQEEARRAEPDDAGRERIREVHERAITQLGSALGEDLREELSSFAIPFENGTPSPSEIAIAQAQIIGWLEGLFQGIQAAIFNQQMEARQQLDGMRQRQLPPGMTPPGQPPEQGRGGRSGTGQYL
jgi:hypothetical protein